MDTTPNHKGRGHLRFQHRHLPPPPSHPPESLTTGAKFMGRVRGMEGAYAIPVGTQYLTRFYISAENCGGKSLGAKKIGSRR